MSDSAWTSTKSNSEHRSQQWSRMNSANAAANDKNRFDDLLIFGYACKVFRDDEKALYIDQGKHLIPWMGDSTLKIDRYDVRATLTDITQYEAPPGGYDNRLDYLSAAEQRAEQLCEEERYLSLYNNDVEEELYKEEELKRLKASIGSSGYGQVAFSYDQPTNQSEEPDAGKNDDKDDPADEPYVPHRKFYIPPNMELPETLKVHAIIEKTAKFISTQGAQMEILIKAKQANNPLFEFLNQSSNLNPFYKHTLQAMKDGNYPEEDEQPENDKQNPNNVNGSGTMFQSYYNTTNQPKIHVPVVKYKPSANCAYTQLISKIKGVPIMTEVNNAGTNSSETTTTTNNAKPKEVPNQPKKEVEVKKISSGLMLAQYYNSDSESENENDDNSNSSKPPQPTNEDSQSSINSIPSLGDSATVPAGILVPPAELRTIIDKTAAYVLKNGKEFEDILRIKNDERFKFLKYTDQYYKYYTYKVTGTVVSDPVVLNLPTSQADEKVKTFKDKLSKNNKPVVKKPEIVKPIAPVSFSIKAKDESTPVIAIKPALPLAHSSDEEDGQTDDQAKNQPTPQPQHQYASAVDLPLPPNFQKANLYLQASASFPPKPVQNANDSLNEVEQSDSFIRDSMLERELLEEKKMAKRAEDKIKDRLAQLAREKLGVLSKEKQLQLERKRRAMAFLNQINGPTNQTPETAPAPNDSTSSPLTETKPADNDKNNDNGSGSDSSDSVTFVMSSPSTSLVAQLARRQRNLRTKPPIEEQSDDDDVIEIVTQKSRSRSRSRSSRSGSKSSSTRYYRHKSKHKKKKSSKRVSRSRSRSSSDEYKRRSKSRYSRSSSRDHKRKKSRSSSKSKHKKRRHSDD